MTNPEVICYFINLDQRADRLAFFEAQAQRLGLKTERVPAITPDALSDDDLERYCGLPSGRLRANELACLRSHQRVWRALLESGSPYALVFEDDAVLSSSLPAFLDDALDAQFYGLDLIRLEAAKRARILPSIAVTSNVIAIHPFRSTLMGAAGYMLSREGACKLLDHELGNRQLDLALYDPFTLPGRRLKRAQVVPALCIQHADLDEEQKSHGVGRSDIDPTRGAVIRTGKAVSLAHNSSSFEKVVRAFRHVGSRIRNAADHLWQLTQGLQTIRIPFKDDTAHQ